MVLVKNNHVWGWTTCVCVLLATIACLLPRVMDEVVPRVGTNHWMVHPAGNLGQSFHQHNGENQAQESYHHVARLIGFQD